MFYYFLRINFYRNPWITKSINIFEVCMHICKLLFRKFAPTYSSTSIMSNILFPCAHANLRYYIFFIFCQLDSTLVRLIIVLCYVTLGFFHLQIIVNSCPCYIFYLGRSWFSYWFVSALYILKIITIFAHIGCRGLPVHYFPFYSSFYYTIGFLFI